MSRAGIAGKQERDGKKHPQIQTQDQNLNTKDKSKTITLTTKTNQRPEL